MTQCIHSLREAVQHDTSRIIRQSVDLSDLSHFEISDPIKIAGAGASNFNGNFDANRTRKLDSKDTFYDVKNNDSILSSRPWKKDAEYFKKVHISALALMKMTIHAQSGGSIEIMGMLTGKIVEGAIVVMDVYSLPVEGTETRVNAQAEAYEYMVQFLDTLKSEGREENIVGWYHSHPGYGCWLSGIDVATQKLNQDFQDPYLAIVIDPVRTANQGKVEIGAFRTYPDDYQKHETSRQDSTDKNKLNKVSKSKQGDFGIHANKYYSLDIEIFKSKQDDRFLKVIRSEAWMNNLIQSTSFQRQLDKDTKYRITNMVQELDKHEIPSFKKSDARLRRKFYRDFEPVMSNKLMDANYIKLNKRSQASGDIKAGLDPSSQSPQIRRRDNDDSEEDNSEDSRSDYQGEGQLLDIDDHEVDDAMSMDSSRPSSRKQFRTSDMNFDQEGVEEAEEEESTCDESDKPTSNNTRKRVFNAPPSAEDANTNSSPSSNAQLDKNFKDRINLGAPADDADNEIPDDNQDPISKHKKLLYGNRKKAIRIHNDAESDSLHDSSRARSGQEQEQQKDKQQEQSQHHQQPSYRKEPPPFSRPYSSASSVGPNLLLDQSGHYASGSSNKIKGSYKGIKHIERDAKALAEIELSEYMKLRTQQSLFL